MPTEIPSLEDFRRLEAKLDQVLKLLNEKQKVQLLNQYIERSILITILRTVLTK